MMSELKPCPFCGSTDVFIVNMKIPDYTSVLPLPPQEVICSNCGMGVVFCYANKSRKLLTEDEIKELNEKTAKLWNRRVNNEPVN